MESIKAEPLPPGDWWPPDFESRPCDVLIEMPKRVISLQNIGERLFTTLDDGTVIDLTDLLGEPKH